MPEVKLIECPRDAMQGIKDWIPTEEKIQYIQSLLRCGFDTIDFGSFVSPKAIPQMQDTAAVLGGLDLSNTDSKLLAIVANVRGAQDAVMHPAIDYLGYPFSISENFQMRNTHKTIAQSVEVLKQILELASKNDKKVVTYLSMGFGNPYGDPWNVEICQHWVDELANKGIKIIALSDTIGVSNPESISYLFGNLIPPYPDVEFGAHLHTRIENWEEKVQAAYENGCLRFDGAIKGYGGCPMAKDDLTGNMPTEMLVSYFDSKGIHTGVNTEGFDEAFRFSSRVFL